MFKAVPLAIAGAALAFAAPSPAAAQWANASKTAAILGGAPSALTAILAAQGSLQPSAGSTPPAAALFRNAPYAPRIAAPVATDRPDVFNSVALPIGHTPLDRKWQAVEFSRPTAAAISFAGGLRAEAAIARAEAVNAYVNARVRFVDDSVRWHVADRWSPAAETLASGRGDCEDYAIAKLAMLRRAGFAEHDLYLVILKDLVRRADHAVAVVRANGRFLVLDNGTDRLLDSSEIADYRPVMSFTAGHAYLHGYRHEMLPAPVDYAMVPALIRPAAGESEPLAPETVKPLAQLAESMLASLPAL